MPTFDYESECVSQITDGEAVDVKSISDSISGAYETRDYISGAKRVVIIFRDGRVSVFEPLAEYDTLGEIISEREANA